MATLWFLFAVLCIATAAPADKGGKPGVAVVSSEAVPVMTAVLPKAEENDVALRQIEEELKQKEGVLKEEVMAAAPAEKAMKEVEEPLVEHTNELQDPQSNPEAQAIICPDGWISHGARCYTVVSSSMDWNSAEDHCRAKGANLASIHNPDENRFLKQLVKLVGSSDVWIGAYNVQTRWRWSDGTGFYFSDWSSPTSTSPPCTCLNTNAGWVKASCSANMRFICTTTPGSC